MSAMSPCPISEIVLFKEFEANAIDKDTINQYNGKMIASLHYQKIKFICGTSTTVLWEVGQGGLCPVRY